MSIHKKRRIALVIGYLLGLFLVMFLTSPDKNRIEAQKDVEAVVSDTGERVKIMYQNALTGRYCVQKQDGRYDVYDSRFLCFAQETITPESD